MERGVGMKSKISCRIERRLEEGKLSEGDVIRCIVGERWIKVSEVGMGGIGDEKDSVESAAA
jgi:hypothetical protein